MFSIQTVAEFGTFYLESKRDDAVTQQARVLPVIGHDLTIMDQSVLKRQLGFL